MYVARALIIFWVFLGAVAQASDLAKEARWRDQVVGDLFDGAPITLNDGQVDFLGLLTTAEPAKPDAVIVLHGVGAHPDWPQVVNPLRVRLAEGGWTTLSIQLPVLANDAEAHEYAPLIDEAAPRIGAAIDYLHENGFAGVYIVAHSMGSRMAASFLAQSGKQVAGFVGVGMNRGTVAYLARIGLPILDLYGSEDLEGVLGSAQDRAKQAVNNADYRQVMVEGADHFFNGKEDDLYAQVQSWLIHQTGD